MCRISFKYAVALLVGLSLECGLFGSSDASGEETKEKEAK